MRFPVHLASPGLPEPLGQRVQHELAERAEQPFGVGVHADEQVDQRAEDEQRDQRVQQLLQHFDCGQIDSCAITAISSAAE